MILSSPLVRSISIIGFDSKLGKNSLIPGQNAMTEPEKLCPEKLRIDKWLWAARFYKTRSAAAIAVTGGKVHVNRQRVKAAHAIKRGDEVRISKGIYEIIIIINELLEKRGPAKVAQTLYTETEDSISKRNELRELNRLNSQYFESTPRRPDKRQRREILKLKK